MKDMTHPMSHFFNSASWNYTMKTDGYRTMTHNVGVLGVLPYARAHAGKVRTKKAKCASWYGESTNDFNDHDNDALVVARTNHELRM
jgi:hypothetical protein